MTTDISIRWDMASNQPQDGLEDYDYDGGNSSSRLFERSRIKALAEEREVVQTKTFCKWVNSHLVRANCRISDLMIDMRDGKMLIKLLEILSGERLPRPTKGKMKIHCLENVEKALQFLKDQRVHLENLGAHDVVDGNPRLTLGLIWTIILRFQIQDITIEQVDNQETKSAKDALLLWCQMKTAGYPNVNVRNFTTSWRDGLAFNALIHKHRPDLIDFEKLSKSNAIHNLNKAFNVAEDKLGLSKLLDAEDVFVEQPDEKSIITYVVTYYHYFSKMKQDTVHGRRIGKAVGNAMDNDKLIEDYERLTSDLLRWIEQTIAVLGDRNFTNSLVGVQKQLADFNQYRTAEKPGRFEEKGDLEVLLFTIQSRMRANNQKPYLAKEGKMISDINKAWEQLEKAEHERELALREELIRQEKLEQLAARFDRKAGMRETWLSENQRLVSQDNFGGDLASVEAAAKKHEAIETDILAYEERVQAVVAVAQELEAENYHDIDRINARKNNVLRLWNFLLELLRARRQRLQACMGLQQTFQEILYILDAMEDLKKSLTTTDLGKHLMGVQDLLQKHSLVEADINVLSERVKAVVNNCQRFLGEDQDDFRPAEPEQVQKRIAHLEDAYAELVHLALQRRQQLEQSKRLCQFFWDMAEEEAWIKEKEQILSSMEIGHDLHMVHLLISKNKAMENELAMHEQQLLNCIQSGNDLIAEQPVGQTDKIAQRIQQVQESWDKLKELEALRAKRLNQAVAYHQFFTDADDVDTWMLDTLRVVSSEDVGRDEANVQSLLKKHKDVNDDLKKYTTVIDQLHQQAGHLGEQYRESPEVLERLGSIDRRYKELLELAQLRKQRLLDALSLYKLFNEADGVEQWIVEKEKMLQSMRMTKDMEDLEVMKHRFHGFQGEMNNNASRVAVVKQLAKQLLQVEHPNSHDIQQRQNQLNHQWGVLRQMAEKKRDEIEQAHGTQTFYIECRETITWIEEKTKLIQATEDLGDDLTGIMTLQRRLSGMERDLGAIQAKLDSLDKEADRIKADQPEEAQGIQEKIVTIQHTWEQLTQLLKERDAKLEEAGDLHRFLRDLDHFQAWLTKTQTDIASEEIPSDVTQAERLLSQHQAILDEIENYTDDKQKMMEYGERITQGQTDDPQYMFLRERLKALEDGWNELKQMWENRQHLLTQNVHLQVFLRDARQADILLNQQDNALAKEESPVNLEQVENMLKRHETLLTTMDANDEKINGVVQYGRSLCNERHYGSDKIAKKCDDLLKRRDQNREKAAQKMDKIKDQLSLQQILQDCEEFGNWVQEKHIFAQDETYRSAKTVHSKWTRHQAFEAEIQSNKDRLLQVEQAAKALLAEKPELASVIEPKLSELNVHFENLEETTRDKGVKLFDANRQVLYEQTCDDIDTWITDLENQVLTSETGQDLTSVNLILQRQQAIEDQMAQKARQVDELENQAEYLQKMDPEKTDEIKAKKAVVQQRFAKLQAPLNDRKAQILRKKEAFQFRRDIEDEKLWIAEKMPLATSDDMGNSLFSVQMLKKKQQSLKKEIDNHQPRIDTIVSNGQKLIHEGHEDSGDFDQLIAELLQRWQELNEAIEKRKAKLLQSEKAQQYYFDASEAEAWMSEQELYMMVEDKGKDEMSAHNLMKKQANLEQAVEDYADTVRALGETASRLIAENHPQSEQVGIRQSKVDKLYAGLKDLAGERRGKLNEALKLFGLSRDIDDLMQWIAEREVVAGSQELGQDYEHVTNLRERFKAFREETLASGNERVDKANAQCDQQINQGHSDNATIAQWRDTINDAWADLKELMKTRSQVLKAFWELHKWFHDCRDVLGRIVEKQQCLSDELGRDAISVQRLQKRHTNFEKDLQTLRANVQQVQSEGLELQAAFAGEREREIVAREHEVAQAWQKLLSMCDARRGKLSDTGDLFRFLHLCRDLQLWMEDVVRQMNTSEKPRDVSGVELLMNNHQSLKAEIDAREDNIAACVTLGQELLARNHYASGEIKEKLLALTTQRNGMMDRWEERSEHLQLILEVYQFARDAAVAEAWLVAQEPYLLSRELGHTIDEVDTLIKKHESFEKSAAAQEERFTALERLTTPENVKFVGSLLDYVAYRELDRHMKRSSRYSTLNFELKEQERLLNEKERRVREEQREAEERVAADKARAEKDTTDAARARAAEQAKLEQKSAALNLSSTSAGGDDYLQEGSLLRKHEWESTIKRAQNRSWEKVYLGLRATPTVQQLGCHKDAKHMKSEPLNYFKGEQPISLAQASADIASDYKKKKHVFRLKCQSGAEFLFQAKDDDEMNIWINNLRKAISMAGGAGPSGSSKSQTMPAGPGSEEQHRKKGGFLTFKRP
ncbi:spectrin beta chain-like [Galendromus occidentalis]|uniref:Spectrin beta chain n=1 Tax=Galendromus occidentalis TaxID=34638 RepID=A0AAJ7WJJ2_9ACAR|nr:spectrin beta chain-like [Galendromus occidentalis]